uniref:Uncharacterized protein n=1 Tax=Hyaloperonospora arabidopsidis (strain Emoy2) TaxID=559515 RepID=M4B7Q0_HYAAE
MSECIKIEKRTLETFTFYDDGSPQLAAEVGVGRHVDRKHGHVSLNWTGVTKAWEVFTNNMEMFTGNMEMLKRTKGSALGQKMHTIWSAVS